ncbi:M24 family metallopeptidase [Pseudomonas abietaniphila]|uniref:M24 family metallopeptidase n=1 Tax=Pseudomonas abietaniphila TaxID=89065 RepID=UPI0007812D13|nr:Xaa-Pro peptidase family protein [Pseudomonas abietaniphila]
MNSGLFNAKNLTVADESELIFRDDPSVSGYSLAGVDSGLLGAYAEIDRKKLRTYRLERIREQLRLNDYAGVLLADPVNIRYATDTNNLGLWVMHSPSRYVFVATEGPVILFDFTSSKHNSTHVETIDEIRPATPWLYFLAGPRVDEKAALWAKEMADLVKQHGGGNCRLAVDRCDPWGAEKIKAQGIELFDAQPLMEQARLIKSAEEIQSHRVSMGVCDLAIARMRASLVPGITENQLWSILHGTNVAQGGEWAESRLLSSGPRTNPWFQDATDKVIEAGEMVCFDTDMVGPGGYLSDISRSFVCPGKSPTGYQRSLMQTAADQISHNTGLLRPGLTFRDFAEQCWPVPHKYEHNRYMMMLHGVGLVDEYPSVAYAVDFSEWGYDGVFQENMVVSVESYIGEEGGREGVKLEEQVLISASGAVKLSSTPLVDTYR